MGRLRRPGHRASARSPSRSRRPLYLYVVAQPGPVSRDQAAAGVGCPGTPPSSTWTGWSPTGCWTPSSAARRAAAARAPAGRPSSTGARTGSSRSPCRSAATTWPGTSWPRPSSDADAGRRPGARRRRSGRPRSTGRQSGRRPSRAGHASTSWPALLAGHGYEPRRQADRMKLANCPFHALARAAHRPGLRDEPGPAGRWSTASARTGCRSGSIPARTGAASRWPRTSDAPTVDR